MTRPCFCDRYEPGKPYRRGIDCRRCWNFHNDPAYHALWSGQPIPGEPLSLPVCDHFDEQVIERISPAGEECACPTKWVYGCDLHGRCARTPQAGRPGLVCCETCPDHTSLPKNLPPLRDVAIQGLLPGQAFNPTIISWQGKLLCCYRLGWSGSRLYMVELDRESYQPVSDSKLLDIHHKLASGGQEDPRLFVYNNYLYLQFSGVSKQQQRTIVKVMYARLNNNWEIEHVWNPVYEAQTIWEKNWQPFAWQDQLLTLYRMDDKHRVLRLSGEMAYPLSASPRESKWEGPGKLRGGAPPVKVGDEYYCWFHATDRDRKPVLYSMGVATFESEPPFAFKRITPLPVLSPRNHDLPPGWWASVVFPGGAILRENKWIIAYGYHDHQCRIIEFDFKDIESLLVPF